MSYPTEDKIGLYIDSNGNLIDSPVLVLIIHAIQIKDDYFISNLENLYKEGKLSGSDYRLIQNIEGS